ncbi:transcriptional regulator [Staphylococcus chromogenes]|uniref:helix-turn-helix domain-containing protein n=1 Tax=Staphylococcus chromogenes TaxID=46126 RepID=UPI000D1B5547|nr:helix-turn-helix domain-containing protein [Staphylococcus chromogenes]PTG89261.1 transcriptional regulator [Staphylococcus chromogenes]
MKHIGKVLQGRRERMGLTLSELEKRTHIQRETLIHLENNNFEALNQPEYAKGFIQKYAHAVNMDAKALMADHEDELPPSYNHAQVLLNQLHQNPDAYTLTTSTKEPKYLLALIAGTVFVTSVLWAILSLVL